MTFLLDTNICSSHMRRPAGLAARFVQYGGRLFVPSIVLAELYAGAYRGRNTPHLLRGIDDLLESVAVLPFDEPCAIEFGKTSASLIRRGISVATPDLMIAAVALVHDMTLVTNNTSDFRHVPGLRLDDWLGP